VITSETVERPDTMPEGHGATSEPDAVTVVGVNVQDRPVQKMLADLAQERTR